jgi:hypothetical protein
MALRLMLVRESFNNDTGLPEGLYLAHGTPRQWLEPGRKVVADRAPTCFGPVSFTIEPIPDRGTVNVRVILPGRNPSTVTKLKLRMPAAVPITAVTLNGRPHEAFDAASETVDLSGVEGEALMVVHYRAATPKPEPMVLGRHIRRTPAPGDYCPTAPGADPENGSGHHSGRHANPHGLPELATGLFQDLYQDMGRCLAVLQEDGPRNPSTCGQGVERAFRGCQGNAEP